MLKEYLSTLANQFRRILGTKEIINAQDFADKINEVKIYGWNEGMGQGYNLGLEEGKQAEYDDIRDIMQDYGNRTDYSHFLSNPSYIIPWFKPKYDMRPTTLYMFQFGGNNAILNTIDFVDWFAENNVVFDTSNCTDFQYAFTRGLRYGVIDIRSANSLDYQMFFGADKLHTIEELIVKETQTFGMWTFSNCVSLKNLKITGTIGNSFTISSAPLTATSIKSVINALSTTATGKTLTLNKTAVQNAFGTNYDSSTEWTTLKNSKSNWTITLS